MQNQPTLKIKKLSSNAVIPTRGTDLSVGYDLFSTVTTEIVPQNRKLISTGLLIEIPEGHYGRIAPRSGLAYKCNIDVCAGVIDPDYRGEVKVLLHNASLNMADTFRIHEGDRIAQLILERCSILPIEEVVDTSSTERGDGGFGSTGKR